MMYAFLLFLMSFFNVNGDFNTDAPLLNDSKDLNHSELSYEYDLTKDDGNGQDEYGGRSKP